MATQRRTLWALVPPLAWHLVALACGNAAHEVEQGSEAARRHQWARWRSLQVRARQVAALQQDEPHTGHADLSSLIERQQRDFRLRHGLSQRDLDALMAEGTSKGWLHSQRCHVDPDAVYRVGFPGLSPVATSPIEPSYSRTACEERLQGLVILELIVGGAGVRDSVVLKGLSPDLDAAAARAAREVTWLPPLVCGKPATVAWTMTLNFLLPPECPD